MALQNLSLVGSVKTSSLETFIRDALRLARDAVLACDAVEDAVRKGALEEKLVEQFYHSVHSLKGTASMVPGAEPVVAALHELEGKLAVKSELTGTPAWLDLARTSLRQAHAGLTEFRKRLLTHLDEENERAEARQREMAAADQKPSIPGIAVKTFNERFWFPMESILEVVSPRALSQSAGAYLYEGRWIPIVYGRISEERRRQGGAFGLIIQGYRGQFVVLVEEIEALKDANWALQSRVLPGLGWLDRILKQHDSAGVQETERKKAA